MILAAILLAACAARIPYVIFWDVFYNSDYALTNLVGLHFMRGEFSLYLWGQHYHASVEPLIMAPLFRFFGATPSVAATIPVFFSLVFIALYYFYLRKTADLWTARVTALLCVIPAPFLAHLLTRNGNYIEIACLGLLHFILFRKVMAGEASRRDYFLLGLTAGFSWFYLRLILLFWLAIFMHLAINALGPERAAGIRDYFKGLTLRGVWRRGILAKDQSVPAGLRVPLALLNLYNLGNFALATLLWFHGPYIRYFGQTKLSVDFWPLFESSLKMAFVSALIIHWRFLFEKGRAFLTHPVRQKLALGFLLGYSPAIIGSLMGIPPDSRNGIANAAELMRNFKLVGTEFVPALAGVSGVPYLYYPALLIVAAAAIHLFVEFFQAMAARIRADVPLPDRFPVVALAMATFLIGITYDKLVDSTTLRYFFPFFLCVPFSLALLLRKFSRWEGMPRAARNAAIWIALLIVLANSASANLRTLAARQDPHPYAAAAEALKRRGVTAGYADYWIAYCVTFLSKEEVVIVAMEDRNRYPPYLERVRAEPKAVFLGEPLYAAGSIIELKGTQYRVTSTEFLGAIPAAYLDKI